MPDRKARHSHKSSTPRRDTNALRRNMALDRPHIALHPKLKDLIYLVLHHAEESARTPLLLCLLAGAFPRRRNSTENNRRRLSGRNTLLSHSGCMRRARPTRDRSRRTTGIPLGSGRGFRLLVLQRFRYFAATGARAFGWFP